MFGFNTRTTVLCRNGIVLLLLFPLYLLARFALWLVEVGRVFYHNELPGKRRGTGGSICGSVEIGACSSALGHDGSAVAVVDEDSSFTPTAAARVTVRDEVTGRYFVVFGRPVGSLSTQTNEEKQNTNDASTQTDAVDTVPGNSDTTEKTISEASTQTDDYDVMGSSCQSSPTTLVNTPTIRSSEVDSQDKEQQIGAESEDAMIETQDGEEQLRGPDAEQIEDAMKMTGESLAAESAPKVQEALMEDEMVAPGQSPEEATHLQSQTANADSPLENCRRQLRDATASSENLQTQLDTTTSLVSELQISIDGLKTRIVSLEGEVQDLTFDRDDTNARFQRLVNWAADNFRGLSDMIGEGRRELGFFIRLFLQLCSRFNEAGGALDNTLGVEDMMRLAAQRLSVYVPTDNYFRDVEVEELEDEEVEEEGEGEDEDEDEEDEEEDEVEDEELEDEELEDEELEDEELEDEELEESQFQLPNARVPAESSTLHDLGLFSGDEELWGDEALDREICAIIEEQHGTVADTGIVTDVDVEGPATEDVETEGIHSSVYPNAASDGIELFATSGEESQRGSLPEMTDFLHNFDCSQTVAVPDVNYTQAASTKAPKSENGASAPMRESQTSSTPISNEGMDIGNFNGGFTTDFNFVATTPFEADLGSSLAGSEDFVDPNHDESHHGPGPAKRTRTASKFGSAAGLDSARSSSSTSKEEARTKKTSAPLFEAMHGIDLSPLPTGRIEEAPKKTNTTSLSGIASLASDGKVAVAASFDSPPQGATEPLIFPSMGNFHLPEVAAGRGAKNGPAGETKTSPFFELDITREFSFVPSGFAPTFGGPKVAPDGATTALLNVDPKPVGFAGKGNQNEESTKKAGDAPIFTPDAFAEFDTAVSDAKFTFDEFKFGTALACEVRPNAPLPIFNFPDPNPFDFGEKCKQKERSTRKAKHAPIFTEKVMEKFGSPSPENGAQLPQFNFGNAGISVGQAEASSFEFDFGLRHEKEQSSENRCEELKDPFQQTPRTIGQDGRGTDNLSISREIALQIALSAGATSVHSTSLATFTASNGVPGGATSGSSSPLADLAELDAPSTGTLTGFSTLITGAANAASSFTKSLLKDGQLDTPNYFDSDEYSDSLYSIEEDYVPPMQRLTIVAPTEVESVSATNSIDGNEGEVMSAQNVDSAPTAASAIPSASTQSDPKHSHQRGAMNTNNGDNLDERDARTSRTSSIPLSTSEHSADENTARLHIAHEKVWQTRSRTAAEHMASWDLDCRERWREPEWPASLPPLEAPESDVSAELSALPTKGAAAIAGFEPSASSTEAMDEEIVYLTEAIAALNLGPATSPAVMREVDREVHFLSGDWAFKPYTARSRMQEQSDGTTSENKRRPEPEPTWEDEPQAEVVNEEDPTAQTNDSQQDLTNSSQDSIVEPEAQSTAACSTVASDGEVAPPTAPQIENSTEAPSTETRAPVPTPAMYGRSRHGTPVNAAGQYRMWSMKKR